jgi:hypothetical protein
LESGLQEATTMTTRKTKRARSRPAAKPRATSPILEILDQTNRAWRIALAAHSVAVQKLDQPARALELIDLALTEIVGVLDFVKGELSEIHGSGRAAR